MYSDHIQDSDINVCRTSGDYDLGEPLKYRDAEGNPAGPLTSGAQLRAGAHQMGGPRMPAALGDLCQAGLGI